MAAFTLNTEMYLPTMVEKVMRDLAQKVERREEMAQATERETQTVSKMEGTEESTNKVAMAPILMARAKQWAGRILPACDPERERCQNCFTETQKSMGTSTTLEILILRDRMANRLGRGLF